MKNPANVRAPDAKEKNAQASTTEGPSVGRLIRFISGHAQLFDNFLTTF
jgi:hypothetical protein